MDVKPERLEMQTEEDWGLMRTDAKEKSNRLNGGIELQMRNFSIVLEKIVFCKESDGEKSSDFRAQAKIIENYLRRNEKLERKRKIRIFSPDMRSGNLVWNHE